MTAPQTPEYHRLPPNSYPDSPAISTHSSVHGSIHSSVISNTQPIFTTGPTRILNLPNRAHNPRYVPNFGISRYKSAFQALLPFRRGTRPEQEIAVDHVGICSYMSFNWVTGLLYKGYRTSSSEPEHIIGSPLDSCDVNGQSGRRLNLGDLGQSIMRRGYARLCFRYLAELLSSGVGMVKWDKVKNRRYTRSTDWPGVRAKTSPERLHVQEQVHLPASGFSYQYIARCLK
uniref:Uncharacterized protein n=1 Tax=Timema shepardi TaxID=629360 RepID=A0A7R9B291_TIMSH|nr:unnamed protein product [Timema shepardi]